MSLQEKCKILSFADLGDERENLLLLKEIRIFHLI